MIYAVCFITMFIVTDDDYFFRLPGKHLGRIVHGLCFPWVNDSSIRCIRK